MPTNRTSRWQEAAHPGQGVVREGTFQCQFLSVLVEVCYLEADGERVKARCVLVSGRSEWRPQLLLPWITLLLSFPRTPQLSRQWSRMNIEFEFRSTLPWGLGGAGTNPPVFFVPGFLQGLAKSSQKLVAIWDFLTNLSLTPFKVDRIYPQFPTHSRPNKYVWCITERHPKDASLKFAAQPFWALLHEAPFNKGLPLLCCRFYG